MKTNLFLIICLIFFSCNQNDIKETAPIDKFERGLGKQEITYLNEMINDFDSYLDINYPNQEFKFKSYLLDIYEQNIENYWKIDSNRLMIYKESGLFKKYDKII